MEIQKYCVYNQTRESFLSLGVTVADATTGDIQDLVDRVSVKPDSGVWIIPYRGTLAMRSHSPVDLVYLDSNYRVIQEIESFLASSAEALRDEAASVLVLPAHTIYSSQTQPGDQMVICIADEMERRLERLSGSFAQLSSAQAFVYPKEKQPGNGTSAPAPMPIRTENKQAISKGTETMENGGSKTGKRGSLLSWIQNWLSTSIRPQACASPTAAGTGGLLLDGQHAARLPNCRYQLKRILRAHGRTLVSRNDGPDDASEDRSKWEEPRRFGRSAIQSRSLGQ